MKVFDLKVIIIVYSASSVKKHARIREGGTVGVGRYVEKGGK